MRFENLAAYQHLFNDDSILCVRVASKDDLTQKMRPVSSDAESSNPNVSDLMDEFIQERLRAGGTSVSLPFAQL